MGWAIEVRINGEDPFNNFIPSLGLVDFLQLPAGPGVRFDTMLFEGLDIPVFYDSLLGKLIVWAEDREKAIERMKRALRDLIVSGPITNQAFHLALMDHPDFRSGAIYTSWLESNFTMPELPEDDPRLETALIVGGLAASLIGGASEESGAKSNGMTRWDQAARTIARRGIRIEGGRQGWRRGTVSR